MKLFVAFAAVILAVSAASNSELWSQFKKNHNKTYKNIVEERLRYAIFENNLKTIEEHNIKFEKGESSYKLGINKFADWTRDEFIEFQTFKIPNITYTSFHNADPNLVAPDSIDWRTKGAVSGVKNQGQCGSCWAFSVTGALEAQNIIKHNKKITLSEQDLVDCTTRNNGCAGGFIEYGFQYVLQSGIATEAAYPYKAVDGTCQSKTKADIKVTGYVDTYQTEAALLNAVGTVGPVSVSINADSLQFYHSGIFDESSCSKSYDHGVLTVGYGTENNTKYWIIKNSWGADWGENGYFRLVRDKNQQCGIGGWNTYPEIA